jgi:hypothetical protein
VFCIEENDTMQIGISLQNNWGVEDVQSLVHLAHKAEKLGVPPSGSMTMYSMRHTVSAISGGNPITNL